MSLRKIGPNALGNTACSFNAISLGMQILESTKNPPPPRTITPAVNRMAGGVLARIHCNNSARGTITATTRTNGNRLPDKRRSTVVLRVRAIRRVPYASVKQEVQIIEQRSMDLNPQC